MAQTYHRREIADYCLQHAIRRINETRAQTRPFPHFWIEGIFPDDVYDDIVRAFPEQELFDGYGTNAYAKKLIWIVDHNWRLRETSRKYTIYQKEGHPDDKKG